MENEIPASVALNAERDDMWLAADILRNGEPDVNEGGRPLILCCGNCSHQIQAFANGPWDKTENLKELMCPDCKTGRYRFSIILATSKTADNLCTESARQYVLDRCDWAFWHGKIVSENAVDDAAAFMMSDETPDLANIRNSGIIGYEWQPSCPTCGQVDDGSVEFDFHHWDYEDDVGVQICRQCHRRAHGGERISERDNDGNWKFEAAKSLINIMHTAMKRPGKPVRVSDERINMPPRLYAQAPL